MKMLVKFFLFALSTVLMAVDADEGHCVWYGSNSNRKPFFYLDKPKEIDDYYGIRQYCSHLLENGNTKVCCDKKQIAAVNSDLYQSSWAYKTDSDCFKKLKRHVCNLNCAPNQNLFMNVTELIPNSNQRKVINGVQVFMTYDYRNEMFHSCNTSEARGTFAYASTAALFVCRIQDVKPCHAKEWFDNMGDAAHNSYVKLQTDFIYVDDLYDGPFMPLGSKKLKTVAPNL